MLILAAYYTLADIVLLGQCLYYRWRDHRIATKLLLPRPISQGDIHGEHYHHNQHHHIPDVAHLSPATPLLDPPKPGDDEADLLLARSERPVSARRKLVYSILLNASAIVMVIAAGVFGWYLTPSSPVPEPPTDPSIPRPIQPFNPLGQLFGYLCAFLYLSSRLPQIYLNHRRQTVEGLSLLFFLFACLGNLTYVVSILAYVPPGAASRGHERWDPVQRRAYHRYLAVNASWLLGSVGTLALDMIIFVQFFMYRDLEIDGESDEEEEEAAVGRFYEDIESGDEEDEEEQRRGQHQQNGGQIRRS